jgi:hypothetical protein
MHSIDRLSIDEYFQSAIFLMPKFFPFFFGGSAIKLRIFFTCLILLLGNSCRNKSAPAPLVQIRAEDKVEIVNRDEYRIGLYQGISFAPEKISHIIVIGSAIKEDSDQFFQSGISRAHRYKELWPEHQIVFISSPDVKGERDEDVFKKFKVQVIKQENRKLTASILLEEISAFTQIASLDFFGHSSPWAMKIGKSNAAFDTTAHTEKLMNLRKNFLPNAYATLNACNTGFYLAPALSKALALPVTGSLTSSMFERIESDGHWYKEEDRKDRKDLASNKFSYKQPAPCYLGFCTRMRTARTNYSSYWGTFEEGGLSFDKFFCNYENNNDGSCERGMAYSILGFPSVYPIKLNSGQSEYKKVVLDWLCSTGKKRSYFKKCANGIEEAIQEGKRDFQSHPTNELNCDFTSCHAEVICKYDSANTGPIPGSCHLKTIKNPNPTNTVNEYLSLMEGFNQIIKKEEAPTF